jgi:hypothetical protein
VIHLRQLAAAYRTLAVVVLNTLVLLVVLNLATAAVLALKEGRGRPAMDNRVARLYGEAPLRRAYPGLSRREIDTLLGETWKRSLAYEPYTGFKESPFSGAYVNVDRAGFRRSKNQAPWPPEPGTCSVFVFGGSTTFGYGLADDQTLPSYLQEVLAARLGRPVAVYNFGRAYYFSRQEGILFETLLLAGLVPDMAIFVDGFNEFAFPSDRPLFTPRLEALFEDAAELKRAERAPLSAALRNLPVVRALRAQGAPDPGWTESVDGPPAAAPATPTPTPADAREEAEIVARISSRYLRARLWIEAVANAFGVKPVFVWQPISSYKYDLSYHLFTARGFGPRWELGYRHLAQVVADQPPGSNFLWCADIQEGLHESLYVDNVHYSPGLCQRLANEIARRLEERGLLPCR